MQQGRTLACTHRHPHPTCSSSHAGLVHQEAAQPRLGLQQVRQPRAQPPAHVRHGVVGGGMRVPGIVLQRRRA